MYGLGEPGNGSCCSRANAQLFPGPVNVPQEAMYWWTNTDGAGHALSGVHDYVMHFPAATTAERCIRRLRWVMRGITSWRIRSIATASATDGPRAKPRRFGRCLHSERCSGGARFQLAARAFGQVYPLAARLHTRRGHSPRRVYGAAGCRSEVMDMNLQHSLIFGSFMVAAWLLVIYLGRACCCPCTGGHSSSKGSATAPSRPIRSIRSPKSSSPATSRNRLELEFDDCWREPRHARYGWLVRPQ